MLDSEADNSFQQPAPEEVNQLLDWHEGRLWLLGGGVVVVVVESPSQAFGGSSDGSYMLHTVVLPEFQRFRLV